MFIYSTQGIILSRSTAGEADAIFSIYTKDFGKILARAQGIKKEEAKLKGHLETLHLSSTQFVLGKNGARLIGASLLNSWPIIRSDFDKSMAALRITETFDRHCFPNDRDESLWNVLLESLTLLERSEFFAGDFQKFLRSFEEKFSVTLGYGDTKSAVSYGIL
ncbi:MAG: DNA repair protein RecO [Candidatus Sungbacteria bacterium]|nr:DNA repair protein RecO [Candidatus Sungbacteria bacterium]